MCCNLMLFGQDDHFPPLSQMIRRIDVETLTTVCIVDCRLHLDDESLTGLRLRTLIFSRTHLRSLPPAVFSLGAQLETFKVDRNSLAEIPADIARLTGLRTFCCDSQRPRLRTLPVSALLRLSRLETLSFADNRIDTDLSWVTSSALPRLRVLRAERNSIRRLAPSLADLDRLTTLDVAHNRLVSIPASLVPLVRRLCRFDYFQRTLRPRHVCRCRARLVAHLELELFLSSVRRQYSSTVNHLPPAAVRVGVAPSTWCSIEVPASVVDTEDRLMRGRGGGGSSSTAVLVRDVTIAVVGETHAGKSTLVAALADELGLCRTDPRSIGSKYVPPGQQLHASSHCGVGFECHQFEMRSSTIDSGSGSCHVCALVLGNEVLDSFSEQVRQKLVEIKIKIHLDFQFK